MIYDKNKISLGLDIYLKIMDQVNNTNVYDNSNFRKMFIGYYKLRQKSQYFYDVYFEYMEKCKGNIPLFETALRYIYEKTGEVHYSFCSKLIATLDPSSPILDQYILKHCGFSILNSSVNAEERIKYYTNVYYTILSEYEDALINSYFIKKFIKEFNEEYPKYAQISNMKKIDCLLVTKGTQRSIPYLKNMQYLEIIINLIKRNDVPFVKWIKEVKTISATPVTSGLSGSIKENLEDISPFIMKFLIDCFEKGMTPFEAVMEWA